MKPRILFVAYQVQRGSNGGMESATQLFEALAEDFQWTLLTNRDTPRSERWRKKGAQVITFKFQDKSNKIVRGSQLGLAALRAAMMKADIHHANDIRSAQMLLVANRLNKVPLVLTLRGMKPESEDYGVQWFRVMRKLDALVTLSNDMAQRVKGRLPVSPDKMHIVSSVVDINKFRPVEPSSKTAIRSRLGINNEEIAVGMIGGVFDIKQQLNVIRDVFTHLKDLPLRLHVVGDFEPTKESYARDCVNMVERKGLGSSVVFHGFRSDVADWLVAFDVVLVASRREGLARCMIEAMACGTPVISTDVCSAREMLQSTGAGVVVGLDDWLGLTVELRELCVNPRKRHIMGQMGREAAISRFSEQVVSCAWRDLYHSLDVMSVK